MKLLTTIITILGISTGAQAETTFNSEHYFYPVSVHKCDDTFIASDAFGTIRVRSEGNNELLITSSNGSNPTAHEVIFYDHNKYNMVILNADGSTGIQWSLDYSNNQLNLLWMLGRTPCESVSFTAWYR